MADVQTHSVFRVVQTLLIRLPLIVGKLHEFDEFRFDFKCNAHTEAVVLDENSQSMVEDVLMYHFRLSTYDCLSADATGVTFFALPICRAFTLFPHLLRLRPERVKALLESAGAGEADAKGASEADVQSHAVFRAVQTLVLRQRVIVGKLHDADSFCFDFRRNEHTEAVVLGESDQAMVEHVLMYLFRVCKYGCVDVGATSATFLARPLCEAFSLFPHLLRLGVDRVAALQPEQ